MMYSFARRRAQGGVTLVETLAVLAISSIIMIPLLGWGLVAIQEQDAVLDRNTDGVSIGLLRTYFVRDVASATDAKIGTYAEDTDCSGGPGAGAGAQTLLRLGGDENEYVVYNEVASSGGVGLSIWRRECDGTTLKATTELVDRVASGSTVVSCTARDAAPVAEEDCGRVSFALTTEDAETVSMTATVRAGKTATAPPGPVYVSPDVIITVNPTTVFRGDVVTFDASGSYDPKGGTLSHHWDFGDGTTSTDAVATHAYITLGEFTAVYTATNSDGTPASDYVRVTVNNRPPIAVISEPTGPITTYRCTDVTFAAIGSNDAGDAPYGGTVDIYQWFYGEGGSDGLTSPAPHTHQFRADGNFLPSLVVVDNDGGASAMVTTPVSVVNRPPDTPVIAADGGPGPITGLVSKSVAFSSTASDPDLECADTNETLTYAWTFGDGGTSSDPNPNYTYTTGGLYTAQLTVTDGSGVSRTSNPITVDLNTSPVASFTMSPSTIRAGQALPSGWITNNSSDPDGNPLTAAWTFPYGTPGSSSAWTPPSVTFNHNVGGGDTFVSANYTVGLIVTDSRGAPHSQNKTITVTGAPYPTGFSSPSHGCERRDWLGVCQERYINFNWTTVPNVNLYQIDLDCDDWLGCGGDRIRNFSGPVAYFDGLPNNVLASLDYDARIRSRDSITGKWGGWSPFIDVESG